MLLKRKTLDGIVAGDVSLVFRRWKRPTVKAGGRLRTVLGELAIEAVELVTEGQISKRDAERAGYSSRQELLAELARREGELYRIAVSYGGADSRLELRDRDELSDEEFSGLAGRLSQMDDRSSLGHWTALILNLVATNPGTRAPDLAASIGWETKRFKANVRKLKELGLTESLRVGYRLSPRGKVVVSRLNT